MPRLAFYTLIYFSSILTSFSQNILSIIDDEQRNYLYSICKKINKYSDTEYIKLKFPNYEEETHSIKKLLIEIGSSLSHKFNSERHDILFFNETNYRKKLAAVEGPKFFAFSKIDGQKILKFDCVLMKFGRKKIGPFEIPYSNHIIIDPIIEFYIKNE